MSRTLLPTALAMAAFAGNSLLARAALAGGSIDAGSFTAIRLASGALALGGLVLLQGGRLGGDWASALALGAYALAFSLAYLRLTAATGALILFAAVQGSMILWGLWRGDRPSRGELAGLAIAFAAFLALLLPGLDTPDPAGSALMMTAGIAWGAYSIRGRAAGPPLANTAGNFLRAGLACAPLLLPGLGGPAQPGGMLLAVVSGVVTSGLGYALWYRALAGLSTTQAATVQLTVPLLAALGAVALLSEPPGARLLLAGAGILGGVAVAIRARR